MSQIDSLLRQLVPLYEHMDVRVELPGDGVYRVTAPMRKELSSHVGTMHPAFQWAAAELLGGLVALDVFPGLEGIFLVVKGVNIEFLRPARTDVVATCTFPSAAAQALRDAVAGGEGTFDLEMTVEDQAGETVARATGQYLVRPRREQA